MWRAEHDRANGSVAGLTMAIDFGFGELWKGVLAKGDKISTVAKAPVAGTAQIGGIAAGEFTKSAKRYRRDLDQQYQKMQAGQLGYSDAERNQMAYANAQQNLAQAQAQQAQAQQQFAATGSTGRTGAYTNAMNAISGQQMGAVAGAGAQADAASAAQAQQNAEAVRQRLLAQYKNSQAVWQAVGQSVVYGITGKDPNAKQAADDKEVSDAADKLGGGTANSELQ